jgi:5-methylcytosine-specific restriction enzyme subunit McrC
LDIPILNIYYLLLYAWNRLEEAGTVKVSAEDATDLLDLFARVLIGGTRVLLKQGLDRGYISLQEDLRGLRGRVDLTATIQRQLMPCAKLSCRFDELSRDVLHNRILKTTIQHLASDSRIDRSQRQDLADLHRRLFNVEPMALTKQAFGRVQLHRNNRQYGFLMDVCELLFDFRMVAETEGDTTFLDFIRKRLPQLFEDFVRNFYKIELEGYYNGFRVIGAETIEWDVAKSDPVSMALLPKMFTDISIDTPSGYAIVDTKFYRNTLATRFDPKLHSIHLYQIFAYLKNIAARGGGFVKTAGVLLYPTVEQTVSADYWVQGHKIRIRTVDLSLEWPGVHKQLLSIILNLSIGNNL